MQWHGRGVHIRHEWVERDHSTQLENLTGLDSITVGMPLHVAGLVLFNTSGSSTEILADRVVTPEN